MMSAQESNHFVDVFHVIRYWLDLKDSQILNITGWFSEDNLQENRVKIIIGNHILDQTMEYFDDVESRLLIKTLGGTAKKLWLIQAKLPSDFTEEKELCIETIANGSQHVYTSFLLPIAELKQEQGKLPSCVDSVTFADGSPTIQGWVLSPSPVNVSLKDDKGNDIPHTIQWILRKDVSSSYRGSNALDRCGFSLHVNDAAVDKVTLVFSDGDVHQTSYPLQMKELQRMWNYQNSFSGRALRKMKNLVTGHYAQKSARYIKHYGWGSFFHAVSARLAGKPAPGRIDYTTWRLRHLPTQQQLEQQRNTKFPYEPKISFVIPLYKTPENFLQLLIESIQKQTYSNWELCFSDGSGKDTPLKEFLTKVTAEDPRIHVYYSETPLQISDNTNIAIQHATGDFIAFADHDDLLAENALFECVKALNESSDIDMIYTDEDKVTGDGNTYFMPHFKPDFNLDLLRSTNYFCHLCVVKHSLLDQVGMLRREFDGSQDYDFVLRCVEKAHHIHHIPKVLYHWRAHMDSTAENPESKWYAFDAGKRAVEAHYHRVGLPVTVSHCQIPGIFRADYHWEEKPLISIIIPNKDHISDLDICLQSLLKKATYPNYEIIIVENNSTEDETFKYYKKMEKESDKIRVVYYKGIFNYSKINNFGVSFAKGDYYLLLNNDTEIINPDCLEQLLGFCMRPDVGAVGARLYYNDETVQHAGVIVGMGGVAGHAFAGVPRDEVGYFARIISAQDYSAVTAACMMVKKSVYHEVGGLSEDFQVAFNDIDFCLRIREKGYLIVYNPFAELYHYESKSRGQDDTAEKKARFLGEVDRFKLRWPEILEMGDPYYNVNLSLTDPDFSLRNS